MVAVRGRQGSKNGSCSDAAIVAMTWENGDCLSMTLTDITFNLVTNKGDLDWVMCSSDQIKRRMNMYRDEVKIVLRMGDLEYEDVDSDNTKGGEEKCGTTMTLPTAKPATRKDKKKSATTMAAKKNENKKKPREESCGVVKLVKDILVLTRMYKLIMCMASDVCTIMS